MDEKEAKADELIRRLMDCNWFLFDDVAETTIYREFFEELKDYVSGK
jgi:hypothetical protein